MSASVDGKSEVVPEWYEAPTFYFTNPHTVRATGDLIAIPETQRLDVELELAVVIGAAPGSTGENLDAAAAASHIFGYTVMNDWSARDLQSREMKVRLGPAKGKDFAMTLGPWIVTADELEPFLDDEGFLAVRAELFVNGELIGHDLVSNMGWPFPELVMYAARNSVVVPGDVLGSGRSETAAASASCGAVAAASTRARSNPATRCAWSSRAWRDRQRRRGAGGGAARAAGAGGAVAGRGSVDAARDTARGGASNGAVATNMPRERIQNSRADQNLAATER